MDAGVGTTLFGSFERWTFIIIERTLLFWYTIVCQRYYLLRCSSLLMETTELKRMQFIASIYCEEYITCLLRKNQADLSLFQDTSVVYIPCRIAWNHSLPFSNLAFYFRTMARVLHIFHVFPATQDKLPVKQCDVSYVKVECYEDSSIENSSFPSLILKPILPLLSEGKTWSLRGEPWSKFLQNFVCSCAQRAKQLKYNYFGVKRFGESQLKSWNFHVANIYLAICEH